MSQRKVIARGVIFAFYLFVCLCYVCILKVGCPTGIGGVGLLWENQFRGYWIVTLDSEDDSGCEDKGMYFRGKMGKVRNGYISGSEK